MALMKPWLSFTPDQKQQLKQLADRLQIAYTGSGLVDSNYYGLTSYTLRDAKNNFTSFLRGTQYYYGYNDNGDEDRTNGQVEHILLNLLASFDDNIRNMIKSTFQIKDRGGTDRSDPLTTENITGIAYFPKGITDFKPATKLINTDLSAKIQREIIKENGADPDLAGSPDLTITVKVFSEPGRYLQTYFNKKSAQTIRRIIYKTIQANIDYFNMEELVQNELDKKMFEIICNNFFVPTEDSVKNILEHLETYIADKLKHQEENLVKIFASEKQKAMNQSRRHQLEDNLKYAEQNYNNNMQQYAELRNKYLQARKAIDTFEEIEFEAVEVFLNKIKEYPRTKLFAKINSNCLQFLIEEPLIHTESETWAKYLTNTGSNLNTKINNFAQNMQEHYNTTFDILKYAVQRLFKEVLVDQKIRLYTAAVLGLTNNTTDFRVDKYSLSNNDYFPHPHIGTNGLTCWSEATRQISKCILENDGEMAFLQLNYALQQMTASDSVVAGKLTDMILSSSYRNRPYYLKKNNTERTSFDTILKEFIADETNKINSIIDSES